MSRILSKEFRYVPAAKTDIGKRFRRIWAEQKEQEASLRAQEERNRDEAEAKLTQLPMRKKA